MQIDLQPFVAATLAVALLAACGERAEEGTPAAAAPAAGQQTAQTMQTTTAQGTTTTFGKSTSEPQQPPAQ
jgi:outer membrane biogenesis lipoprotein LolB